jgi:tRNA synthetases class I (I, L, M and V)
LQLVSHVLKSFRACCNRSLIYHVVPERPNFPKEEEKVLKFWTEIQAFEKQLELSKGKPSFTFYDGPPFATGLPHYGHIAAGTIKVSLQLNAPTLQTFTDLKKKSVVLESNQTLGCGNSLCDYDWKSLRTSLWLGLPRSPH